MILAMAVISQLLFSQQPVIFAKHKIPYTFPSAKDMPPNAGL
jgi:hypothetical protein